MKSIPREQYKHGMDFDLWVAQFFDNVRAVNGLLETNAALDDLCRNWVSTKLEIGSCQSVYDNLPVGSKANWRVLRDALSEAFKDHSKGLFVTR